MKKNFMAIASLLIAAMLLVVSCSQEIAPKDDNNGLVEASLSVGYGRDINVDHVTDANGLTVQYKMTPQWVSEGTTVTGEEQITNPAKNWTTLVNGNLGWLTPGYWLIEVKASKGDKDVFSGNVYSYFTDDKTSAVVYLNPVNTTNKCSISIEVSMQDIVDKVDIKDEQGNKTGEKEVSYSLKYDILTGTGTSKLTNGPLAMDSSEDTTPDNITTYKASLGNLDAGFYTAVVYVVDENGNTVGGIRKGFLLTNGDNATLTGHIEPADYSNVTINAVYVDVNIDLVAGNQSITNGKYKVVVTATDQTSFTSIPASLDDFDVTYLWFVDGEEKSQIANPSSTGAEIAFDFDKPGYKNIACQAIYKSKSKDTVYFTETKSIYVLVNPSANQSAEPTT